MRTPRRPLAAVVLVLATGALAWGTLSASRARSRTARFQPPFPLDEVTVTAPDGAVVRLEAGDSARLVVLYVSWTCPHCDAEMRRWAALLERKTWPGLELRIVAGDPPPPGRRLPRSLRGKVFVDADRSVARVLGASAVPTTAFVLGGMVLRRVRGETSLSEIRRRVESLLHAEAPNGR